MAAPTDIMQANFYKNYLLIVLLLILAFNSMERLALGLLLQDIKIDFGLSDTQLGVMSGMAFALFYSVMGVPIARWADRGNRVTIISLTTALWSAAVALCGLAANFLQLLMIRVGVAVGEAGCIPPAHSLMAEYFSRSERPRAVAIYFLGGPLGFVIGYFVAGWLNEFYGWRATFMLLGLPGLVLAPLAWLTLKEPRSRAALGDVAGGFVGDRSQTQVSLKEVCATLWANTTFRHLLIFFSIHLFFTYGILQWQPAFFVRSYGLSTGELGTWLAAIYGLGGLLGTYWGGGLASRYAANNERLQLSAIAMMYASLGIMKALVYLSPNHYLAFGILAIVAVGSNMVTGPLFATIQTLIEPRMRAMSVALIYLVANFIGMGLGPLAAGVLSDAFRSWAGEESLRYALVVFCPGFLWAGWHVWRASRTVTRDVQIDSISLSAPSSTHL